MLRPVTVGRNSLDDRARLGNYAAVLQSANLRGYIVTPQYAVHGVGDIRVNDDPIPALYLHQYVECRGRFALQHCFLSASPSGLDVAQRDRLDTADQIRKGRVHYQVVQRVAVGRCD